MLDLPRWDTLSRQTYTSGTLEGIIDDLNISQIVESPYSPRVFSTEEIGDLADSIREKGLLNPIIVRIKDERIYEIVAGNRRYEACKALGWRKITCQVVELDDKSSFEISLVENIQRRTLYPIEEGRAFQKYVSEFGWGGASQLAKKIGKSVSYITKRIRLLDLSPDIIDSVIRSGINTSIAEELFSVKDKEIQSEFAKVISKKNMNVRQTRQLLERFRKTSAGPSGDSSCCFLLKPEEDIDMKSLKSYAKSISILRVAMVRMGDIINNIDNTDWMTTEILMYHKNIIHGQIDLLIKEKLKKQKARRSGLI